MIAVSIIAEEHEVAIHSEEALVMDMLVNFYKYDSSSIHTFMHHLMGWENHCMDCLLAIYRYIRETIKATLAFKNIIYVETAMVIKSYVKTSAWISITIGGGLIKYEQKAEAFY